MCDAFLAREEPEARGVEPAGGGPPLGELARLFERHQSLAAAWDACPRAGRALQLFEAARRAGWPGSRPDRALRLFACWVARDARDEGGSGVEQGFSPALEAVRYLRGEVGERELAEAHREAMREVGAVLATSAARCDPDAAVRVAAAHALHPDARAAALGAGVWAERAYVWREARRRAPAGYERRAPAIGYGPILDADPAWHRELRLAAEARVADGLRMWLGNPFSGRLPGAPAALVTELLGP